MRRYELDINGRHFSIGVREFSTQRALLDVDGTEFSVVVSDILTEGEAQPFRPARNTAKSLASVPVIGPAPKPSRNAGNSAGTAVKAPIPGQITAIIVKDGDVVEAGQPLLKMEAMKMENTIRSTAAGTVASLAVTVGDVVAQGYELMVIG